MASGNKSYTRTLKTNIIQVWWHTPITQEAEAENHGFKASLGYRVKTLCQKCMCCLIWPLLGPGRDKLRIHHRTGPAGNVRMLLVRPVSHRH